MAKILSFSEAKQNKLDRGRQLVSQYLPKLGKKRSIQIDEGTVLLKDDTASLFLSQLIGDVDSPDPAHKESYLQFVSAVQSLKVQYKEPVRLKFWATYEGGQLKFNFTFEPISK